MTTLTADQTAAVRRILDPAVTPHLSPGLGTETEPCTIAAINLALTGVLRDGPHPCMSDVIRRFVISAQDALDAHIRDSQAYRQAAMLIPGTAADEATECARADLILDWMWEALADPAVLASVPDRVRPAWDRMLTERTPASAYAANTGAVANTVANANANYAATAVSAFYAADAAAFAAGAAGPAADAWAAYWARRDIPGLLTRLCTIGDQS